MEEASQSGEINYVTRILDAKNRVLWIGDIKITSIKKVASTFYLVVEACEPIGFLLTDRTFGPDARKQVQEILSSRANTFSKGPS